MRDAPLSLLPNLRCSGFVMRQGIRGVAVLIRVKIGLGFGLVKLADAANRAIGSFVSRRVDDFGSVRLQNLLTLRRSAGRKKQFYGIAQRGTYHGIGDAGVSAGGIENCFAG